MRIWTRTPFGRICGRCAAVIAKGAPILVIELPRVSQTKVRCESCAGPAPADLPALVEQAPIVPLTMHRFDVNSLPLDFKQLASREPGEDDAA